MPSILAPVIIDDRRISFERDACLSRLGRLVQRCRRAGPDCR
ncbi:MAG: hypothetical protein QOK43_3036 [Acidimicrobiaceae bacterium]|nr:hypothetical protein [Acidimicrobiaceae bacterium]MDQ1446129.1 hypothetical protein [Acidimicrobiaceae bacterium]